MAGTGVSLDSLVHGFRSGQSPETIREDFDTLTLEQVYRAIAYYLASQPKIDAYLIRQKRRYEEARRAAEPLPAELRQRIETARHRMRVGPTE